MSRCLPNASWGPLKYTRIPYHNWYPLAFHPGYVSCGIMDSERSIGYQFRFGRGQNLWGMRNIACGRYGYEGFNLFRLSVTLSFQTLQLVSIIDVAMFFTATWGYIAAETGWWPCAGLCLVLSCCTLDDELYIQLPPPPALSDALGQPQRLEEAYSRYLQVFWLYAVIGTLSFRRRRAIAQKMVHSVKRRRMIKYNHARIM